MKVNQNWLCFSYFFSVAPCEYRPRPSIMNDCFLSCHSHLTIHPSYWMLCNLYIWKTSLNNMRIKQDSALWNPLISVLDSESKTRSSYHSWSLLSNQSHTLSWQGLGSFITGVPKPLAACGPQMCLVRPAYTLFSVILCQLVYRRVVKWYEKTKIVNYIFIWQYPPLWETVQMNEERQFQI
jgi:hypothetical protein